MHETSGMPEPGEFERMLREAPLRVTRPRLAVLTAVHAHPHADTDSILGFVRQDLGVCPTRPCTTCCGR
jgi:Fur family ferric uptake transcriptional regulator